MLRAKGERVKELCGICERCVKSLRNGSTDEYEHAHEHDYEYEEAIPLFLDEPTRRGKPGCCLVLVLVRVRVRVIVR
jgi:hypothetical protein